MNNEENKNVVGNANNELNSVTLGAVNTTEQIAPEQSLNGAINNVITPNVAPIVNENAYVANNNAAMNFGDMYSNNLGNNIGDNNVMSPSAPTFDNVAPVNNIMNASTGFNEAPLTDTLEEPKTEVIVPENETVGAIPPNKSEIRKTNKIVFIILIVALIAGVAYGFYYFLSMNLNKPVITLKNLTFNALEEIPTDLNSYATFENVDTANCSLNTVNVDNTKAGVYKYSVTCEDVKAEGNITIIDDREFSVETNELTFFKGTEEVDVEDFIKSASKDGAEYEFADKDAFIETLSTTGGPNTVEIIATDEDGNEVTVEAEYYVILAYFDATGEEKQSDEFNVSYKVKDRFYIGTGNIWLGKALRNYVYSFSESTYASIKDDYEGKDEFDGYEGNLVFDDENLTLIVETTLSKGTLDKEYESAFPEKYSEINSYYKGKDYTVKIIVK